MKPFVVVSQCERCYLHWPRVASRAAVPVSQVLEIIHADREGLVVVSICAGLEHCGCRYQDSIGTSVDKPSAFSVTDPGYFPAMSPLESHTIDH